MAEETGITWCDSTFNPWIGCTKVSPGCDSCYAEVSTPARTLGLSWGVGAPRHRTAPGNWALPARWQNAHRAFRSDHGRKRRVFCASLGDVFDQSAEPSWRDDLWELVRRTPDVNWLVLTKRIGNAHKMLPEDWGDGYKNVWLGITVVNQFEYDRDVPKLFAVPAAIRWLSMEPLLGPVTLRQTDADLSLTPDWCVVGGESGRAPRPMDLDWARSLKAQCEALHIPFFFKQVGGSDKGKGGTYLDGEQFKAWPGTD